MVLGGKMQVINRAGKINNLFVGERGYEIGTYNGLVIVKKSLTPNEEKKVKKETTINYTNIVSLAFAPGVSIKEKVHDTIKLITRDSKLAKKEVSALSNDLKDIFTALRH